MIRKNDFFNAKGRRRDSKKCMIMANDNNIQPVADDSQIVLYQPDESIRLEVKLDQDTVWLTQAQMTELFRTTRNNITMHIRNIFKEKELDEKSVCKDPYILPQTEKDIVLKSIIWML